MQGARIIDVVLPGRFGCARAENNSPDKREKSADSPKSIDINGAEIIRINVGALMKMDGCNLNICSFLHRTRSMRSASETWGVRGILWVASDPGNGRVVRESAGKKKGAVEEEGAAMEF